MTFLRNLTRLKEKPDRVRSFCQRLVLTANTDRIFAHYQIFVKKNPNRIVKTNILALYFLDRLLSVLKKHLVKNL